MFDKHGKPLTPPEGITFGGRLGLMKGIAVAPNGDVWALGVSKNQHVELRGARMTASVLLIEALGGGWTRDELPTADRVTRR